MPPSSRSAAVVPDVQPPPVPQEKWIDLDPPLRNSDRLVVVFSQCRWDGRITFSIHREFDRYDAGRGATTTVKTAFIPEGLIASFSEISALALQHIEMLKKRRAAGELPFPEGGIDSKTESKRRR